MLPGPAHAPAANRVIGGGTGNIIHNQAVMSVEKGCACDLLFTDVIMSGGMNGRQVADQVRKLRPGARVLFQDTPNRRFSSRPTRSGCALARVQDPRVHST
jgi:CheY-like chemotaxis protein